MFIACSPVQSREFEDKTSDVVICQEQGHDESEKLEVGSAMKNYLHVSQTILLCI